MPKNITAPQLKALMEMFSKGYIVSKYGDPASDGAVVSARDFIWMITGRGFDAFGQRVSNLRLLYNVPLARGLHKGMLVAWKCKRGWTGLCRKPCKRGKKYGCDLCKPDREGKGGAQ